ncbi:LOW QUALITY PROTEIN: hypothetical protein ACHAXT_003768 [Thalassiosira profunda]
MGLISMFNGLDVLQTRDYIKVYAKTYIERISEKHLASWMNLSQMSNRPTPLPTNESFLKSFHTADGKRLDDGTPDQKAIKLLEKQHGLGYRSGIGELIWPYVTCRPDIADGVVRASQHSSCPAEIHFHAVKHALKYMYLTRDDGIYFWRPQPRDDLPQIDLPRLISNAHDLLLDGRPITDDPLIAEAYMDSDWGSCPRTRRSMGGGCLRVAGGPVAYRSRLQPTVALSSTEGEFMEASDMGKTILSILYDLGVPQEAATVAYEDNNACIAMATHRNRHREHVMWTFVGLLSLIGLNAT